MAVSFQDCQFHGGGFVIDSFDAPLTNSLFERVDTYIDDDSLGIPLNVSMFNCLFYGGSLWLNHANGGEWRACDNAFVSVGLTDYGDTINSNNAYVNTTSRLTPTNVNDVVLASFSFTNGPLGNYYHVSTNLFNKGSRTADLSGLYHFTTQTNQIKETNSVVDMGFHYVAVTNGVPFDTDGDGVPDYEEDINGNGTVNSGETHWQNASDLGLKVKITRPQPNSVLP